MSDTLMISVSGMRGHVGTDLTPELVTRHAADQGEPPRWSATDLPHDDALGNLKLRGPHDLRHTFSTWLEDAGIPARVIDELMGHQRSRHGELDGGSRIGARYRHTTDEMAARVVDAIEARLQMVLSVAEEAIRSGPHRKSFRVF